jgi:predicted DNA-binding transcriptional regulator AlpA
MSEDRLLCDWTALKAKGWPYSRSHTTRLWMAGKFPKPLKLGDHPKSRIAWWWLEVEQYLKASDAKRTHKV